MGNKGGVQVLRVEIVSSREEGSSGEEDLGVGAVGG